MWLSQVGRRGLVLVGFVLALAPLSAHADGNQDAIDAANAEKAWLQSMPVMDRGVALGQLEIANAKAIAKMLSFDPHAQTEIPNSMQQYALFCDAAIAHMQAKVANANAMLAARPWDTHLQDEVANANEHQRFLWDLIGSTYPGNPYASTRPVVGPLQVPLYSDDGAVYADDQEAVADDGDTIAADDETYAAE